MQAIRSSVCITSYGREIPKLWTAAQLPAQGPDQTTQAIDTIYRDRAASINRYFTQLTTEQLTT